MRKVLSIAVAVVAAVVFVGNTVGSVDAQSRGLGITPRKDIVVDTGKTVNDKVTVTNLNRQEKLFLTLQVIDFSGQGETGTPALKLEANAPQTPWSLKPFISAPKTLEVAPGESKQVPFSITIPKDQGAGSYYSAIRYVAEADDGGQVAIGASGATLVFVTVPGQTKESLLLQKFGAYSMQAGKEDGNYTSLFVSSQPKEMAYTLKNQGNVAERPQGSILIKNIFGKEVKVIKDANPKESLALIDQSRRFQVCIADRTDNEETCKDPGLAPGRYTATLNVFYGINGNQTQEVLATASFWYLPVWFLVVSGIVLLALVGAGYMLYRRFTGAKGFKRR